MRNFKRIILTSFLSLSSVFFNQSTKAEGFDMPKCPTIPPMYSELLALASPSDEFECLGTPEKYEITIYEMGLCSSSSHPITGSSGSKIWDKSSCVPTMISDINGTKVDLAPGSSGSKTATLPSAPERPANGTYKYAYILISSAFTLKGSYTLSDGTTYYSKQGNDEYGPFGAADKTLSAAQEHGEEVDNIGMGEGSWTVANSAEMSSAFQMDGGKMSAILLNDCNHVSNDCNTTSAKASSQTNVSKLLAIFEPTSQIDISDTTSGVEVKLVVKQGGYLIGGNNTDIEFFGSAPFRPEINTF